MDCEMKRNCYPNPNVTGRNPFGIQSVTVTNAFTWNSAFYNNREVNRLFDRADEEVDLPKRFALYQQAEELIVRDAPWVLLGHRNLHALRQPWLRGPLVEPLSFYRFDRVWIER
jgi:ABC-type transport system substrate-binding protein